MKLTEFYLELQGRPGSIIALDMETRAPSIPPGYISGVMIQASYTTELLINNYTAADIAVILVDAAAGGVTITLPEAVTHAGRYYYIKKVDSTGHVVTVIPDAADELIDGETSLTMSLQYQFVQVVCSGVKVADSYWHIIGGISVTLEDLIRNLLSEQINLLQQVLDETRENQLHLASLSDAAVEAGDGDGN